MHQETPFLCLPLLVLSDPSCCVRGRGWKRKGIASIGINLLRARRCPCVITTEPRLYTVGVVSGNMFKVTQLISGHAGIWTLPLCLAWRWSVRNTRLLGLELGWGQVLVDSSGALGAPWEL